MKLLYRAEIIDEDTGEVLAKVSSYSPEGLEEEMGKLKFSVGKEIDSEWCDCDTCTQVLKKHRADEFIKSRT